MTRQEIKDMITEKISGQGTMVDAGGALPSVLAAIIDAIPTEPTGLQFGGALYDGDTIPETPNMFYVAGPGEYRGNFYGEEQTVDVGNGDIAFFVVDAEGSASAQTIEITTGGGGTAIIELYDVTVDSEGGQITARGASGEIHVGSVVEFLDGDDNTQRVSVIGYDDASALYSIALLTPNGQFYKLVVEEEEE